MASSVIPAALALFAVLHGAAALGQTITVKDLPGSNVTLIGPGTPEFASALPEALSAWLARTGGNVSMRLVDPLLPYSVIVVNGSDRAIRGITVHWNCVDFAGRTSDSFLGEGPHNMVYGRKQKPIAAPGSSFLVALSQPEALRESERRFGSWVVEQKVRPFKASKEVVVSIDGVLFNDGHFAGPEESDMRKEIEGQYAAAREIQSAVLARLEQRESPATVLAWLGASAGQPIPPRPRSPAAAWEQYWRASIARDVAALQRRKGEQAAIDMIRELFTGPSTAK